MLLLTLVLSVSSPVADAKVDFTSADRLTANSVIATGLTMDQFALENMATLELMAACRAVAIDLEILDDRESWLLVRLNELPSDIRIIAGRFQNMKDWPKLADVKFLPSKQDCADGLAFNCKYDKTLKAGLYWSCPNEEIVQKAIDDNKVLGIFWDQMVDARTTAWYVVVRRKALNEVVKGIGREAFEKGEFPEPVPLWSYGNGN